MDNDTIAITRRAGGKTLSYRVPIRERVKAGLERAKAKGVRQGRPTAQVSGAHLHMLQQEQVSIGEMARRLSVSRATVRRRLRALR